MNSITLRTWHSYIGIFIAPSVIFFALTGATQLFNLHEAHGDYHPPILLEKLASVHKDQVLEPAHEHEHEAKEARKDAAGAPPAHDDDDDHMAVSTLLLKWFFLLVALGLASSTCLGLWIGLSQSRRRPQSIVLLIAGAVIPLVLSLI